MKSEALDCQPTSHKSIHSSTTGMREVNRAGVKSGSCRGGEWPLPTLWHTPVFSYTSCAAWGWEGALVHPFKPSLLFIAFLILQVFSQSSSEQVSAIHSFTHFHAIPSLFQGYLIHVHSFSYYRNVSDSITCPDPSSQFNPGKTAQLHQEPHRHLSKVELILSPLHINLSFHLHGGSFCSLYHPVYPGATL